MNRWAVRDTARRHTVAHRWRTGGSEGAVGCSSPACAVCRLRECTVRFTFGDVVIDTDRFLLERGGAPLHVQPQVFDVISHLVLNRERVVPKTELHHLG